MTVWAILTRSGVETCSAFVSFNEALESPELANAERGVVVVAGEPGRVLAERVNGGVVLTREALRASVERMPPRQLAAHGLM